MQHSRILLVRFFLWGGLSAAAVACGSGGGPDRPSPDPATLQLQAFKQVQDWLSGSRQNWPDSLGRIRYPEVVQDLYAQADSGLIWFRRGAHSRRSDSLWHMLNRAFQYGLFPSDYHIEAIGGLRQAYLRDSLAEHFRRDPLSLAALDLLYSDAYAGLVHDIGRGRLPADSVTLRKDTLLPYTGLLRQWNDSVSPASLFSQIEPLHPGYWAIRRAIGRFDFMAVPQAITTIDQPVKDSGLYWRQLTTRLREGGWLDTTVTPEKPRLEAAVKKFQTEQGLSPDGRAGEATVRMLNLDEQERRLRIAISLDKYKLLPRELPERYIWVNIPANQLQVIDNDRVVLVSRVITGKPKTRTPLLNGQISLLITYPQWVPPPSIVSKEILPAVKKNPGYLARKGFSLLDREGNEVDPYTVDWSRYDKASPYRIVQGSGDANALGVLKFHFDNKYSVYLHDTNQRYLFGNPYRCLSHGCVRVQAWESLAKWLLGSDSLQPGNRRNRLTDSLYSALRQKARKTIPVLPKVPVYIRYITCEAREGKLLFYDDVYGEDRAIRDRYFAGNPGNSRSPQTPSKAVNIK